MEERFASLNRREILARSGMCSPGEVWVDNPRVEGGGYCRAKPGEARHKHKQYRPPKPKKRPKSKKPEVQVEARNEFNPEQYGLEAEEWNQVPKQQKSKLRRGLSIAMTLANTAPAAAKVLAEEAGASKSVAVAAYWFATIGDFAIPGVPVASLAVAAISSAINPKAPARAWKKGKQAYQEWKKKRQEEDGKQAVSAERIAASVFEQSKKFNRTLALDIAKEAMRHDNPEHWMFVFAAAFDDLGDAHKAIQAANDVLGEGTTPE